MRQLPAQGLYLHPLPWKAKSQPLDHQGSALLAKLRTEGHNFALQFILESLLETERRSQLAADPFSSQNGVGTWGRAPTEPNPGP